jgi:ParB family chromosome partitioning protein
VPGDTAGKRRFSVARPSSGARASEDFSVVLTGDFAHRQSVPMDLPIDAIDPSPFQIRRTFGNLEELATAMRQHGFTSRLMVRVHPNDAGRYQLVFGERRLRAARLAGIRTIPCDVTQFSDRELLEIGLTENLQREDLDPLEEAQGLRQFMDQFGYSIRDMAERIGKSRGYIDNRLALLRVPDDVQQMVAARPDTLASAPIVAQVATAEERQPLIEGLTSGSLTAADVRSLVRGSQQAQSTQTTQGTSAGAATPRPSPGSADRATRQGARALQRATYSLDQALRDLQSALPLLDSAQRTALLDHIVRRHFPELEALVTGLQGQEG